jgi:hypothetical protein
MRRQQFAFAAHRRAAVDAAEAIENRSDLPSTDRTYELLPNGFHFEISLSKWRIIIETVNSTIWAARQDLVRQRASAIAPAASPRSPRSAA